MTKDIAKQVIRSLSTFQIYQNIVIDISIYMLFIQISLRIFDYNSKISL